MNGLRPALAGTFLLLTACVTTDPQPSMDRVQASLAERAGLEIVFEPGEKEQALVAQLLQPPLSLEDAVRIALLNSPAVHSAYPRLNVGQAKLAGASLMRNPVFEVASLRGSGERLLEAGVAIELLDLFLMPLRKQLASRELAHAELEVTAIVLQEVVEVREAWINAVAEQQMLEAERDLLRVLAALVGFSEQLLEAGNITQLSHQGVEIRHSTQELAVRHAETRAGNARDALAAAIGLDAPDIEWSLPKSLPSPSDPKLSAPAFVQRAEDRSLSLAMSRIRIDSLGLQAGIENRQGLVPELEGGWLVEKEDHSRLDGPVLSVALPVFDTGRARRAGQSAALQQARLEYLEQALQLRATARQVHRELSARVASSSHIRNQLLPQLLSEWRQAMQHYQAAQIGIPQLLARQVELRRIRIALAREDQAYWIALNRFETLEDGANAMASTVAPVALTSSTADQGGH
ncbi:MAG: TolC family protein [Xanthomonadales bacterium]|nr:TolC family protein [Xanthomonadales bacterium]